MGKEIIGLHYKPKTEEYEATVSIITPVYNEDPQIFTQALSSWKRNNPTEIIAVIDHTDKKCIEIFKEFKKEFPNAVLIVTNIPGKRPALAAGIKVAKSEIVVLVDSDTLWTKNVIRNGLPPFHDKRVAGVATYQSVLNPKTFAQKIFDVQLDMRYRHEYPFLAASGGALVCLSGRTAFYRKAVITPMLDELVNETFMGKKVISGDDKRLTYLVLEKGFRVAFQSNSHVYTPGMETLRAYLKQRLRWTRNGLRADLGAIGKGWPIHYPALLFFQIDKFLQAFVVILSPIYFFVSLYFKLWIPALVIAIWWTVSRTIKMYPHLSLKPRNITMVPAYLLYSFFIGVLKIYAFFTLNTQGWITRWDKSRLPQLGLINDIPAYSATALCILFLAIGVYLYKEHTYIIPQARQQQLLASILPFRLAQASNDSKAVLGVSTIITRDLLTKRHEVKERETLARIAKNYGVNQAQLLYANAAKIPNGYLAPGTILTIPGKDSSSTANGEENFLSPTKDTVLTVQYDKNTNTLLVRGRGKTATLKDIKDNGGQNYLEEVSPKIWQAKASIFIYYGVTLKLNKDEVKWLRLKSNKEGFASILSRSGDVTIDGVKVTSWDPQSNDYDKEISDGRSFIMVKDDSRMDIYNSELAYLGFATNPQLSVSPYGVSWKLSTSKLKQAVLTGEVINSKFHHNYFGAYTYGATGMTWRGNEFYNNVRYGLDPHDDSNGFLVEKNRAHNNGTHGIIFSKRCMYNTVRDNISYNNNLHGIMLHESSDYNIIENNLVYGNSSGIVLWHSGNNIIRENILKENRHGVRANASSNNNIISNNSIFGSELYGVYLYDEANGNFVENNIFERNDVALYLRSNRNNIANNMLRNNNIGIYLKDQASGNTLSENNINNSAIYGIYTKVGTRFSNILGHNELDKNRKDMVAKVNISDESGDEYLQ